MLLAHIVMRAFRKARSRPVATVGRVAALKLAAIVNQSVNALTTLTLKGRELGPSEEKVAYMRNETICGSGCQASQAQGSAGWAGAIRQSHSSTLDVNYSLSISSRSHTACHGDG